ncbi:site-specific DNA-methyltransferase [Henriciella algicola]|uniref:Methyltransferase n=1 Tax=Henriciella algicola TaxID=1608422 RepID=A0A399RFF2_9PROT|nr:DNA methyltransferase [Henriciella algicola]RIJ29214.1 DNA methylase N-4 [Henriciella algicola]
MPNNQKVQRLGRRQVDLVDIDKLKPSKRNARTHSAKQIEQIARSLNKFGWTNPILIDEDATIIAGHGRWQAAKLLGIASVPVLAIKHLSDKDKRLYAIADNKLAENAGWDDAILKLELGELADLDIDLTITGFSNADLDIILIDDSASVAEEAPPPPAGLAITKLGDLWNVGEHRLLCGNALDPASYDKLLQGEKADAVFTDPPYNVPIAGHVGGSGKVKHREFAMASGEMSEEAFRGFLKTLCERLKDHTTDSAIVFICMDWRHGADLDAAGRSVFEELKNLIVWDKGVGGMGSLYRSQHELIYVFKAGPGKHTNNVELGRHGRNRTNVWAYAGVQSRRKQLLLHPTVKPVRLVVDALMDVTHRGDRVLDPFLGSGTTLLAVQEAHRRARGIELDPLYVDVAIRRLRDKAGLDAVLSETGETFSDLEAKVAGGENER